MRPPIKPGAPPSFKQPLRDIMRGVGLFAEMTEDTLEPAANLLPAPVRRTFHGVLTSLEAVGSHAVASPLDLNAIASAAQYMKSDVTDGTTNLVKVLAFAWKKTAAIRTEKHFLFSEVVAARALSPLQLAPDLSSGLRSAVIFNALASAHPIGRMPGVDPSLSPEDETQVGLFLFAVLVWLSTERAGTMDEEEQLLDLALALTMAKKETVAQSFDDIERLGRALCELADHV